MSGLGRISVLLLLPLLARGQELNGLAKRVSEFALSNGLRILLVERHEAPVISIHTYVKTGWADDPAGRSGLARAVERMAFKGTETTGTRDWAAEKKELDAVEDAYDLAEAERKKGDAADQSRVNYLESQARRAADRAAVFVERYAWARIIEGHGGQDLNSRVTADSTEFSCSLPSNRLELWFMLESQRLQGPVFREFYRERAALAEGYRTLIASNPQERLLHSLAAAAFTVSPYRHAAGFSPEEVENLRAGEARKFFDAQYAPGNLTVAIVGDALPADVKRLAERYFGRMSRRPAAVRNAAVEPPQTEPRTVTAEWQGQPLVVVGYNRPDMFHEDDAVFDVLQTMLAGRTGMLYQELVERKKVATGVRATAAYPGNRYPSLFLLAAIPRSGRPLDDAESALTELTTRLGSGKVGQATLSRAKAQARAGVLRRLSESAGMAALLAQYAALDGNWRNLFTRVGAMDRVTADDVARVAARYFIPANRTVARLDGNIPGGRGGTRR